MSIVLSQQLDQHRSSTSTHSMPAVPLSLSLATIQEFDENCNYCSESDDEGSLFSIDFNCINYKITKPVDQIVQEDRVYHVAVDLMKSESSMDALLWTLRQAVTHQTSNIKTMFHVKLVHVFPPVRFIPSPRMLPRRTVSPKMVKNYLAQERDRRFKLLEKYVGACSIAKVKVDVVLIESDTIAKAILDLIPNGIVKNLVVGTTKSSLRKLRSRNGTGVANQILRNAPTETSCCDIKFICEGKELVIDQLIRSPSSRSSDATSCSTQEDKDQEVSM